MLTPIFITGAGRGGTSLLAQIIAAHPRATSTLDTFTMTYKALRNIIATRLHVDVAPDFPQSGYYFNKKMHTVLCAILSGEFHNESIVRYQDDYFEEIKEASAMFSIEALQPDVFAQAATVPDMLCATIHHLSKGHDLQFIGIKEHYRAEYLPGLARCFPDARFITIVRDPRGVFSSRYKSYLRGNPNIHFPSYFRSWRKTTAMAYYVTQVMGDRHLLVRYEDLVRSPEEWVHTICDFCGMPFAEEMLGLQGFAGAPNENTAKTLNVYTSTDTHSGWQHNSSFGMTQTGISAESCERWKSFLSEDLLKLVEAWCYFEMQLFQYEPCRWSLSSDLTELSDILNSNHGEEHSYRESHRPIAAFLEEEALRFQYAAAQTLTVQQAEDAFLMPEVALALGMRVVDTPRQTPDNAGATE